MTCVRFVGWSTSTKCTGFLVNWYCPEFPCVLIFQWTDMGHLLFSSELIWATSCFPVNWYGHRWRKEKNITRRGPAATWSAKWRIRWAGPTTSSPCCCGGEDGQTLCYEVRWLIFMLKASFLTPPRATAAKIVCSYKMTNQPCWFWAGMVFQLGRLVNH